MFETAPSQPRNEEEYTEYFMRFIQSDAAFQSIGSYKKMRLDWAKGVVPGYNYRNYSSCKINEYLTCGLSEIENERLYLLSNPIVYSYYDTTDPRFTIEKLKFAKLSNKEIVEIDILAFIEQYHFTINRKDTEFYGQGDINIYLQQCIHSAKPYLTIKELFFKLINFIGANHIYLTSQRFKIEYGCNEDDYTNVLIPSFYIAKNVDKGNR